MAYEADPDALRLIGELADAGPRMRAVYDGMVQYERDLPFVAIGHFRNALVDLIEEDDVEAVEAFLAIVERWAPYRSHGATHAQGGPSRNLLGIGFFEDGFLLSGAREYEALDSLRPRLGPESVTLLREIEPLFVGHAEAHFRRVNHRITFSAGADGEIHADLESLTSGDVRRSYATGATEGEAARRAVGRWEDEYGVF